MKTWSATVMILKGGVNYEEIMFDPVVASNSSAATAKVAAAAHQYVKNISGANGWRMLKMVQHDIAGNAVSTIKALPAPGKGRGRPPKPKPKILPIFSDKVCLFSEVLNFPDVLRQSTKCTNSWVNDDDDDTKHGGWFQNWQGVY